MCLFGGWLLPSWLCQNMFYLTIPQPFSFHKMLCRSSKRQIIPILQIHSRPVMQSYSPPTHQRARVIWTDKQVQCPVTDNHLSTGTALLGCGNTWSVASDLGAWKPSKHEFAPQDGATFACSSCKIQLGLIVLPRADLWVCASLDALGLAWPQRSHRIRLRILGSSTRRRPRRV